MQLEETKKKVIKLKKQIAEEKQEHEQNNL